MRFFAFLAAATLAAGCAQSEPLDHWNGKIGEYCEIQLRRGDALGAAGDLPIGPYGRSVNGADVSISGKLTAVSGEWITVVDEARELHIPKQSILFVEFQHKVDQP